MNKRQKLVQEAFLDNEEAVIKRLKQVYKKSLDDITKKSRELQNQINELQVAMEDIEDIEELSRLKSMQQSKVYQKQYQDALKKQVGSILDNMQVEEFKTVAEYLNKCYEDGFMGTMFDLHGQGIPFCFPLDQESMVRAVQLDSKISKGLYSRLGEDVDMLKLKITAQVSRGISTGMSFRQVAQQLASYTNIGYNNAVRIARTEGHRIQVQSGMDACYKAAENGADVVKQWDSSLDNRTRPSHTKVDGEIRELDEPFSNGLMFPGDPNGGAAEVANCRCALLQRARWALDEDELNTLKKRAAYYGLDKTDNFDDFRKKYLKIPKNGNKINVKDILDKPIKSSEKNFKQLLESLELLDQKVGCKYNPVINHTKSVSEEEIIDLLSGGDRTKGSCASVALSYVGQKQGWNVLDFRDGESRGFFSRSSNLRILSLADGLKVLRAEGASSITVGNRLLKMCEEGKEYYLCVGRHASIVRKTDEGVLQYLELQSATNSGWTNFNGNPRYTLKNRFGCTQTSSSSSYYDFMIDLNESNFNTDDFKSLLGYINTAADEQRKGKHGTIK